MTAYSILVTVWALLATYAAVHLARSMWHGATECVGLEKKLREERFDRIGLEAHLKERRSAFADLERHCTTLHEHISTHECSSR